VGTWLEAIARLASQFGRFLDRPTATQAGPTDTFCPLGAEPAWGKMSIAYGQAADYLKALLEAQISPASG
jgi:hypothetical protein